MSSTASGDCSESLTVPDISPPPAAPATRRRPDGTRAEAETSSDSETLTVTGVSHASGFRSTLSDSDSTISAWCISCCPDSSR